MSAEKNKEEARRWLDMAADDLKTAEILRMNERFAHACFHAQQAGEKSAKALWYHLDGDPWGHSALRLIEELKEDHVAIYDQLKGFLEISGKLDRFYIPTQYPNGLPDLIPGEAYFDEDAEEAIGHARELLIAVRQIITPDSQSPGTDPSCRSPHAPADDNDTCTDRCNPQNER